EMQVAAGEEGAFHEDGEVDSRASGKILDVHVSAVFPRRNCPSSFRRDALPLLALESAEDGRVHRLRSRAGLASLDERIFAAVPLLEELVRWRNTDDAGVADRRNAYAGDMPGGREEAV